MAAEDWAVAVPQTPGMEAADTSGDGRRFVNEWLAAIGVEEEARLKLAEELFEHGSAFITKHTRRNTALVVCERRLEQVSRATNRSCFFVERAEDDTFNSRLNNRSGTH